MAYAILRTKKLKSVAGIFGSGRHTFREMPTPNSNGAANVHVGGASSAAGLANAVLAKLPERRRKGAIRTAYTRGADPSAGLSVGREAEGASLSKPGTECI